MLFLLPAGIEQLQKPSVPVISPGFDVLEGALRCGDVYFLRLAQQRSQVIEILRPPAVVARQYFERHQVADASNRNDESRKNLQVFGPAGNIAFDARRREKKIDHDALF